ncbi:type II secretion system protein N [Xanthomonas campestris pv. raphani]|uniref:type II secretion system protein N n=1 Tax=Xanthomonas campestris TaxID=339 RepID=UPI002B233A23|nr:type II secretion system protein N [Xanthomonas campestris]MEA9785938.1 type II secretion system protein N [Xanthomonas campestris pv. raphani]
MRLLGWSLLVLGVLIAIVIATLPLRWMLPAQSLPIAVLEAQGSIWNGSLRGVTWKAQPIGDVQVALQPWPLVRGEQRVRLATSTAALIALQGARHGIDQGNGRVLLRQPGGITLLDLAVDLRQVQAVFDATRCVQAAGEVTVQIVPTSAGEAVGLLPLRLRGSPRCNDAAVELALQPDGGMPDGMQLSAELRLQRDGRWQLQSRVDPGQDAALGMGLQLLGFAATPERLLERTDLGQLY